MLKAECIGAFYDTLKEQKLLTQDVLGYVPTAKKTNRKKKLITTCVVAAGALALVVGAFFTIRNRVAFYQSPEWKLHDADGSDFINLKDYNEVGLQAMEGFTVKKISFGGGEIRNLEGIQNIRVEVVDITGCKNIRDIGPIVKNENIHTVILDQDQLIYAYQYRNCGKEFEVAK